VSQSNTPGGGEKPFDVEEFARHTAQAIEFGDDIASMLERRVIRLEEIVAARWPRSMVLRWRLAREIRASVATWDPEYIPRDDFYARRLEAAMQEASARLNRQRRAQRARQAEEDAADEQQGGADPGEGFLP
jgi:hypothetical protein